MSWTERIGQESRYTAPSGAFMTFDYEDVQHSIEKRTSAYNFPDVDGTYVQDLGHKGRRFPLRAIFSGPDCDLDAERFITLLLEKPLPGGQVGVLMHPAYGTVDVVPFGEIVRKDSLKTAANQAIVEVAFYETRGLVFPDEQDDPETQVLAKLDKLEDAAANNLGGTLDVDSAVETATFRSKMETLVNRVEQRMQPIVDAVDEQKRIFNRQVDSFNRGLSVLVGRPIDLGFQVLQILKTPSRARLARAARFDAYKDLVSSIISGDGAVVSPGLDSRNANDFHASDLVATGSVAGLVRSSVYSQFDTATEAVEAADDILATLDSVVEWRDDNFESLGGIDTGAAYQKLQEACALAAGYLIQISFSLKRERRITLDRDRTPVDLVFELYGSVDENLDFFITSNALTGSEILEIPEGREIVFYV